MSHGTAKIHGNKSNRASVRKPVEQKSVFKSVLDNPFEVKWPSIPMNVKNAIIARIVALMEGVPAYQLQRHVNSRVRKKMGRATERPMRSTKKHKDTASGKIDSLANKSNHVPSDSTRATSTALHNAENGAPTTDNTALQHPAPVSRPSILDHIVFGINQVTKRLETQVNQTCHIRGTTEDDVGKSASIATSVPPPISIVLVCREDVNPPLLTAHLAPLVAGCNSARNLLDSQGSKSPPVKLVPLPKGAEAILSEATGLRRVSVIAVDVRILPPSEKNLAKLVLTAMLQREAPGLASILDIASAIPTVTAPWLVPATASPIEARNLEQTHIKQLRTTAPKDIRAAKKQRAFEKAAVRSAKQPDVTPTLTKKRKRSSATGREIKKKIRIT